MQVSHKQQMYDLLAAGAFGNTIPQFFSLESWHASGQAERYPFWGVRTLTPGGPCRLNCPREEVAETVERFHPHAPNISVMISCVGQVTWLGDVWDSPRGLECWGHEHPPRIHDWRQLMRRPQCWQGLAARMLLRRRLNSNSLADLEVLLERYPAHVIELSALDRCFGTVPGRNAVMWECRRY